MRAWLMRRMPLLMGCLVAGSLACVVGVQASDHDDGETDLKARNLGLTDLYVFREDWQTNADADSANLIFIMNVNQRAVARQEYFFSTRARYQFHVTRVSDVDTAPSGETDVILRFEFDAPNTAGVQEITVTAIRDNLSQTVTTTSGGAAIRTTSLEDSTADNLTTNTVAFGSAQLQVFAGLREDPFFFDVEQFFRVRAGALGFGPSVGFKSDDEAVDFAAGYNVSTIVVRVPISFLAGTSGATSFDVWETIFVPTSLTPAG